MKTKLNYLCMLALAVIFGTACSSDDDSNTGPIGNLGEVSLTVSGEVEGSRSGMMDFHHLEVMNSEIWELSGHDFSPQTFSLDFMLHSAANEIPQPGTGTYEIGFEANSTTVFHGIYTHIDNEDFANSVEYSSLFGGGGTLTITTSNTETVAGNFTCTLVRVDDNLNVVGSIELSGTFTAHPRQF